MADKKSPYDKPIKLDTDLYWNQIWYLVSDPQQEEHRLIGIEMTPPRQLTFKLRGAITGNVTRMFDFECSQEKDEDKYLKWKGDRGEDDE